MRLFVAFLLAITALPGAAQTARGAEVFSSAQLQKLASGLAQQARANGGSGTTLGNYGSHTIMLSERTASGGAEIHTHFDDVMIVMEGNATLITGGELIDPHVGDNGEAKGSGIRNGAQQAIAVGDVVHVPAGTAHQLLIPAGTTYKALVIKVKE
jgi:mannose-6-phosphate isomerase-like protein (cupin superfamily)